MLTHLTIRNYAIIDQLELELGNGLTALTGETGAGKSILLGALGLVLGDRADSDSIKQGADHAEIIAEFNIDKLNNVSAWLVEKELNADDECILRRRIASDGRSRAYINSTPVTLQLLRELGEMLIDIHGQHEHQSLMKPVVQRQLLDEIAGHRELIEAVSNLFVEHKLIQEQLDHLLHASSERNHRMDLLRFQTRELDALALGSHELRELNEQHSRLANSERLTSTTQQGLDILQQNDEFNIQSSLARVLASMQQISELDESLVPVSELLNDALAQIEESISQLRHYADSLDMDASALADIEQRLQDIHDIARKHRVEPEKLVELHEQLSHELHELDHADERLEELQQRHKDLDKRYQEAAKKLSDSRKQFAQKLNKKITQSMQTLGMRGGKFEIKVSSADNKFTAHGIDNVEFNVTANAGQACKPLARVASGGELARISLAIQMITASHSKIHSLIFDEVDSGVGGGIAEIVGQHLRTLGAGNQVLCITHLPQVAAQAHQHFRVHKQSRGKTTRTQVDELDIKQRVEEIARMLSGVEITQQSLAHAKDMISRAESS
ncbi:MAG: DNA repair protein RecN [Gammaproteobacteria bacterium]